MSTKPEDEVAALRERCADLEARLDIGTGNMYDVLVIENERLRAELSDCRSALKSMVQQYLYRPLDMKTKEPCEDVYQHDFMSAGEEACDYLVRHGLAKWTDENKYAIVFVRSENEANHDAD